MYAQRLNQFTALRSMAIRITSVFGLRSCADESGCADSIEVTGYILDRDEARPTYRPLSTQMITLTSTLRRNSPTSHAARWTTCFWADPALVLTLPLRGTPSNVALQERQSIPFPTEAPQELRFSAHALLSGSLPCIVVPV